MKILMVGKYFYPVIGGVEIHMQNLANELVKKGHEVEVFTSNKDLEGEKLSTKEELGRIKIRRFSNLTSFFYEILKGDFDIIHFHLLRVPFVGIGIIAGKLSKSRLVLTPHCVYPPFSFLDSLVKKGYDITLGYLSLKFVDKIISLTENDKKDVIELGADEEKIDIIPNCLDFEKFEKLASPELFREKFIDDKFILYVGRIDWNKGLEFMIQAMQKLKELELKFVIIGEDMGYQKELEELANKLRLKNDVLFLGKVPDEVLFSAYSACTIFVLPAFYEGLPTVVLEAMAYKKPVVATKTGGTQYLIKDGYTGFLVNYGKPEELVRKIKDILSSDISQIGENARMTIYKGYSWEKSADKIEQIYKELLKN
jgi:glycosyltransferase involved in cell wall biosynthesis